MGITTLIDSQAESEQVSESYSLVNFVCTQNAKLPNVQNKCKVKNDVQSKIMQHSK